MKKESILWLNSLRGLACIIVIIAHIISIHPTMAKYASGCGKIGVWCFMVLSAYLLYRPYCSEKKEFGLRDWGKFYIRRFVRIMPIYIVALIFSYLIGFLALPEQIFSHMIGIQGIGHFWYMPVIMKFYLIMPIFLIIKGKTRNIHNAIMLLVVFGVCSVLSPYTEYVENSTELRWYLPVFLMGMLLAIMIEEIKKKNYFGFVWLDGMAIVCIMVGLTFIPYMRETLLGIEPSNWLQNKYLIYGGLWSIIVLCISFGKVGKVILTKTKLLQFVGKISFELYLFHYPLLFMLAGKLQKTWMNGIVTIISSTLLAIVVHFLVEKPMQKINDRLKR